MHDIQNFDILCTIGGQNLYFASAHSLILNLNGLRFKLGWGLFPKFFGRPHFPDSDFSLGSMDHKKHQRSKYGRAQLHLPPKNHNGGFRTPGLVGQKLIFSKPIMLYIIGSRI